MNRRKVCSRGSGVLCIFILVSSVSWCKRRSRHFCFCGHALAVVSQGEYYNNAIISWLRFTCTYVASTVECRRRDHLTVVLCILCYSRACAAVCLFACLLVYIGLRVVQTTSPLPTRPAACLPPRTISPESPNHRKGKLQNNLRSRGEGGAGSSLLPIRGQIIPSPPPWC